MRAARRMAALARQAGGAQMAARYAAERQAQARAAVAQVVVAHVSMGHGAVAIVMTGHRAVLQMHDACRRTDRATVTARMASLLAGEVLEGIHSGTGAIRDPGMAMLATRLALRVALGRPGGADTRVLPTDMDPELAYSHDRTLKARITHRLNDARDQAQACLRHNLIAVDAIVAHVLTDGAVDAETLTDLLVLCDVRGTGA